MQPPHPSDFLGADRLASLSDTMFGVAMTLDVTTLLTPLETRPGGILDLTPEIRSAFMAVLLSFVISGLYWISQQQRLAMSPALSRREVWLHLMFLFLVVLVPITTGIPGVTGRSAAWPGVLLYGAHFSALGLFNVLLWIGVHRRRAVHAHLVPACLALSLFILGLLAGAVRPYLAQVFWFATFGVPAVGPRLARAIYGPPAASAGVQSRAHSQPGRPPAG